MGKKAIAVILVVAASACATQRDVAPVVALAVDPVVPPTEPAAGLSDDERRDLAEILAAAKSVLVSERFRHNMVALDAWYPSLWLSPFRGRVGPARVVQLLSGREPRSQFLPSTVEWWSADSSRTIPSGTPGQAQIQLGTYVRHWWSRGTPLSRSCAVNTAAHEISHTLSDSETTLSSVIADRGVTAARLLRRPVASYTIGAVAQCTFLQEKGAAVGDLAACVRRFGTSNFRTGECG